MNRAAGQRDEENLGSFYMGRMRPPPQPQRVLPRGFLSSVIVLSFIGILWYAYPTGQEKYEGVDIPVITADKAPYKFKPEDPGGMEVRHQDSTIFDPLEKKSATVERLLPMPEQPVDKDQVLKGDVSLSGKKPELKLDLEMKDAGDGSGTEKIVSAAAEQPKPEKIAAKPEAPALPEKAQKAKPAAVSGNFRIQLGSYPDVSGVKRDWASLQKKYPQQLKGLSMASERVNLGTKGVWYRLYATKLTEDKARAICAVLKAANPGGCIVGRM